MTKKQEILKRVSRFLDKRLADEEDKSMTQEAKGLAAMMMTISGLNKKYEETK